MHLQLGKLLNAEASLNKLINSDLPAKTSFQVARLAKKISGDIVDFKKANQELIEKYGERKDGKLIIEKGKYKLGKNTKTFNEEYRALIESEIKIDFDLIELENIEGLTLQPKDLLLLESFITI